jgi:calcium-dependent protein kinase
MQVETLAFLANNITKDIDFNTLRAVFRALDKNNTGMLHLNDVKQAFLALNLPLDNLEEVFQAIDFDMDSLISYSQYLAATIDKRKILTMPNLWFSFHHFDVENVGFITETGLIEVFRREGRKCNSD